MSESRNGVLHARPTILPVCAGHLGRVSPWHAEVVKRLDGAFARSHILNAGETYNVLIHWTDKPYLDAESDVPTRQVWLPKVRTVVDYLVSLHEFGHILSPLAVTLHNIGNLQEEMACEAAAWGWAFENAAPELLDMLTDADWTLLLAMFRTFPQCTLDAAKALRMLGG